GGTQWRSRGIQRISPCHTFYNTRARVIIAALIDRDAFKDNATIANELALIIFSPAEFRMSRIGEDERGMGESVGALAQRHPRTLTHITKEDVITIILNFGAVAMPGVPDVTRYLFRIFIRKSHLPKTYDGLI